MLLMATVVTERPRSERSEAHTCVWHRLLPDLLGGPPAHRGNCRDLGVPTSHAHLQDLFPRLVTTTDKFYKAGRVAPLNADVTWEFIGWLERTFFSRRRLSSLLPR